MLDTREQLSALEMKYNIAIGRLNIGMMRRTKKVKRRALSIATSKAASKKSECLDTASNLTEESFYLSFDDLQKNGFSNILTDGEYFGVMKSIGVLSEELVKEPDFTQKKAWDIINQWFDSSEARQALPEEQKETIKKQIASEFTKRMIESDVSPLKEQ